MDDDMIEKLNVNELTREIDDASMDRPKKVKTKYIKSDGLHKLTQEEIEDLILKEHTPRDENNGRDAQDWYTTKGPGNKHGTDIYYDRIEVQMLENIEQSVLTGKSEYSPNERPASGSSLSSTDSNRSSGSSSSDMSSGNEDANQHAL